MGWAVGKLDGRWIGYGVPAICDHPGCGAAIDRGLDYRCGGMSDDGCSGFFCGSHLRFDVESDEGGLEAVCERCANGEPPFAPTPDTPEWVNHILTDDSWEQWRTENAEEAEHARSLLNVPTAPLRAVVEGSRWISAAQQKRDHEGLRYVCAGCGGPETPAEPLDLDDQGYRVHRRHLIDPASGLQPQSPAHRAEGQRVVGRS
jgi:hypothetical protein